MSDELKNSSSGESNPTQMTEGAQITPTSHQQGESQLGSEADNPIKTPWLTRGKRTFLWAWKLFAELVTILWILALWDSYRPKITITPGQTLNAKEPFATVFIVQNEGALPIRNVSFNTTWTYADDENQARNVITGVTKIPELKPLEQHILAAIVPKDDRNRKNLHPPVQVTPTPVSATNQHSLVLWFDVTYDPQFFGNRTTTLYFLGLWDSENNFQWFPTGNNDIRVQGIDNDLLKRANELAKNVERNMTNPAAKPDLKSTNSSSARTNKAIENHTNQTTPVHK